MLKDVVEFAFVDAKQPTTRKFQNSRGKEKEKKGGKSAKSALPWKYRMHPFYGFDISYAHAQPPLVRITTKQKHFSVSSEKGSVCVTTEKHEGDLAFIAFARKLGFLFIFFSLAISKIFFNFLLTPQNM